MGERYIGSLQEGKKKMGKRGSLCPGKGKKRREKREKKKERIEKKRPVKGNRQGGRNRRWKKAWLGKKKKKREVAKVPDIKREAGEGPSAFSGWIGGV